MRVFITGATGFLGAALSISLGNNPSYSDVRVGVRRSNLKLPRNIKQYILDDNFEFEDCREILSGIDVFIHCAARVHVMKEKILDPLAEFRKVNVDGTLKLACQAAAAGVKRFVFISSIGVNGVETFSKPFTESDIPAPHSHYAVSKYEAERGLFELSKQCEIDIVIIRSPLIYGPNAPGNFGSLVRWLECRVPLPLGAVDNRRSLVALDNIVDLIVLCLDHPAAANQTFLVADDRALSTTELLRKLGDALGKPAHLMPVPNTLIQWGASLMRRPDIAQRLCGNLEIDISKARELLGWVPPLSVEEGLRRVARGYLSAVAG